MNINLGWGYPVCVKEVLNSLYTPKLITSSIMDMDYPPYEGKERLTTHIKAITGKKYIITTNGATQAINIVLRALKKSENKSIVVTNKHGFPYYPDMINKAGLIQQIVTSDQLSDKVINLVDMPSNPYGIVHEIKDPFNNTIWDAVYNSKVYLNSSFPKIIESRVEVGSVSKMLGITGARIGWIATDNEKDYNLFFEEVKLENCGFSVLSQDLVTDILDKIDLDLFMTIAQGKVNNNREEFLKLSSFFDNQNIPEDGMFYVVSVDHKGLQIIDKSNVTYITLENENNGKLIRFNLAQNNDLTKKAISAIIASDKIK